MAKTVKTPKLSNAEAWAKATDETRAAWGNPGPLDDNATARDLPEDDRAFWDEVEKRAVALGGHPAG